MARVSVRRMVCPMKTKDMATEDMAPDVENRAAELASREGRRGELRRGAVSACDCAMQAGARGAARLAWPLVFPVLACALCPACLAILFQFLPVAVSAAVSEACHDVVLTAALLMSVSASAWRSWRSRRAWPVAVTSMGSLLVIIAHAGGELPALEWAGFATLLGGGVMEARRSGHFRAAGAACVTT